MSKLRKRMDDDDEGHISESWLIPYADILTLLLALFIVLFASSSIDKQKYEGIMESFQYELMGSNSGSGGGSGTGTGSGSSNGASVTPKPEKKAVDSEKGNQIDPELAKLKKQIEDYIAANQLRTVVTLESTKRGVEVTLQDIVLFDSGKAELKEDSFNTLNGLLGLMKNMDNPISIEGHTDNVPIHSSLYPSNWELSAARAASVLHFFESNEIAASRLQFSGFGEQRPLKPNDTVENRQANRRVTIAVLKKT